MRVRRSIGALTSAWPSLSSVLDRHDAGLDAVVEGIAGGGVGGDLRKSPERASGVSPRATIPDVSDGAVAAFELESELAAEAGGRQEGSVVLGALGTEREDRQGLVRSEVGFGASSRGGAKAGWPFGDCRTPQRVARGVREETRLDVIFRCVRGAVVDRYPGQGCVPFWSNLWPTTIVRQFRLSDYAGDQAPGLGTAGGAENNSVTTPLQNANVLS
eukprot:939473-Rhodomonas_salina.1